MESGGRGCRESIEGHIEAEFEGTGMERMGGVLGRLRFETGSL